jgi:GNAT superfamily N-acetyltransferase
MQYYECRKDNYLVSTNPELLDLEVIHGYLSRSYWRRGAPKEHVARAIENSLNFGLFEGKQQIGFTRVVTDYADFAYLCDVFVLEAYQGKGLGQWLVGCVLACPSLQGLGQITLYTRDAQPFYRRLGFKELDDPTTHLVIRTRRPWFKEEPLVAAPNPSENSDRN